MSIALDDTRMAPRRRTRAHDALRFALRKTREYAREHENEEHDERAATHAPSVSCSEAHDLSGERIGTEW